MANRPLRGRRTSERPAVAATRYNELDRRARRRALLLNIAVLVVIWIVLFGVYYVLPANGYSGLRQVARLAASLAGVGAVLAWQLRRVAHAPMPEMQAVQALGVVIPLFLISFATVYLSLSHASMGSFTEPLDHTGALYLTITIFATVGFGDIAPVSGSARIIVSIQMLLDLAILGVVVRSIFGAAKIGLERRGTSREEQT
jgi:voltage-gated potassium channel